MYEGATTALHFAAQRGYTGAVFDLVELGAQVLQIFRKLKIMTKLQNNPTI
jgi:hypothetical protein